MSDDDVENNGVSRYSDYGDDGHDEGNEHLSNIMEADMAGLG